jgi:hypothetical protein
MKQPSVMFEVALNGKLTILLPSTTCPPDLLPAPSLSDPAGWTSRETSMAGPH